MQEIWKDVIGFENYYEVSNLGKVRSKPRLIKHRNGNLYIKKPTILKPSIDDGYLKSCFCVNKKLKSFAFHRVVAEAFLDKKDGLEVNHINGNKSDNRVENLEYVTRSQNLKHAVETGLLKVTRGSERVHSKTDEATILKMLNLRSCGVQRKDILKQLNLSIHTYKDVLRGKTWRHVSN